jgi:hypothetical protein
MSESPICVSSLGIAVVLQRVVERLDLLLEADALLLAEELGVPRDDAQVTGLPHQHSLQDIRILIKGGTVYN